MNPRKRCAIYVGIPRVCVEFRLLAFFYRFVRNTVRKPSAASIPHQALITTHLGVVGVTGVIWHSQGSGMRSGGGLNQVILVFVQPTTTPIR